MVRLVQRPFVTYHRGDETARAEAALLDRFLLGLACEGVSEEVHHVGRIIGQLLRHGAGTPGPLAACPIAGSASISQQKRAATSSGGRFDSQACLCDDHTRGLLVEHDGRKLRGPQVRDREFGTVDGTGPEGAYKGRVLPTDSVPMRGESSRPRANPE